MHHQRRIYLPNKKQIYVDHKLVKSIKILNNLGFLTCASCQCDPDGMTWIAFEKLSDMLQLTKMSVGSALSTFLVDPKKCTVAVDFSENAAKFGASLFFDHKLLMNFEHLLQDWGCDMKIEILDKFSQKLNAKL